MLVTLLAAVSKMKPSELKAHKLASKQLKEIPVFKPQKRNKLPRPFKTLGGVRIESTGMLDVSDTHVAFMYCRNGQIFTDRAFYAFLFCRLANGSISPVFEFHWHPSHKGFHCKTPCKTEEVYTDRTLRNAPELSIKTQHGLDPKNSDDRLKLVIKFCNSCGISLPDENLDTQRLWQ